MYQVLELNEANTSIPVNYAGKIVHLECYGSEDIKYSVALNKNVSYKRKVEKWFDTFPAPGTTKTVNYAYQLPDDGLILYASDTADQSATYRPHKEFRNGYWELECTYAMAKVRWDLTNFKYVDGVKTTIKSYSYIEDDTGDWETTENHPYPDTVTLADGDGEDAETITITLIDHEITVEDTYCSGSEKRIVGFEPVEDTKEIPLIELENADDEAIVDNPTYDSCAIYCNIGDVISIDNTEAEILASKILIYIEI